jgi:hypothetical protein
VPTYIEHPQRSEKLESKSGKRDRGAGLAYAAAATSFGGTRKTRLVLRYIEKHKGKYVTIIWVDVRSEETA